MDRSTQKQETIAREAARDFREGTVESPDGTPVTNPSQAIAVRLNEAREAETRKTPGGRRGGKGTAQSEGRSGSTGAGRSGSPEQRSTNR